MFILNLLLVHSFPIIESQPNAKHPKNSDEIRPIQWGELNFLHTTDTHGWLAGHILEREFSGDWGDFVSFQEHMKELANEKGVDLITVDSGDRHDGNGLSDASKEDGSLSLPIFCEIDYDIVTIGNHELYRGEASLQEYQNIRRRFGERYVVSNVELLLNDSWVPMGHKYRIFQTENQKFKVLAFGFLFNFEGNDKQISRVTKVEDEVEKEWFNDVMRKIHEIDYIVVTGHIPLRNSPEFDHILRKIRTFNKTIPVSLFGGHSHIRDYRIYDKNAAALQSGRYVETVGWSSVNFTNGETSFSRSYIDFNERNMMVHSGGLQKTERGVNVSQWIANARKSLNLDEYRATIPKTYYTDRAPFPAPNSVYSLLQDKVLPLLTSPKDILNDTRYIIVNTGSIRFDLFKGPYTKDTGYILSPFHNQWMYIKDIPQEIADKILPIINGEKQVSSSRLVNHRLSLDSFTNLFNFNLFRNKEHLSAGYQTVDDLNSKGDDTVHEPWKFYPIPQVFQTVINGRKGEVTLVFQDYVGWFVERALAQLKRTDLYKPRFHGGEDIIDLVPSYLLKSK